MEPKRTAKWVVHYRLLTSLATLAGLAVFVLGLYLGLAGAANVVLTGGGGPLALLSDAVAAAEPVPVLAGAVVGFLLWRVGGAYAAYATTRKVVDERVEGHVEEVLGPAIEEELERQVEFRVEEALADRADGSVEELLAGSGAESGAGSEPTAGKGAPGGTDTSSPAGSTGNGGAADRADR